MADLILASASKVRARLLSDAGVDFKISPAHIDEHSIKLDGLDKGHNPSEIAIRLAFLKAQKISHKNPNSLVLGIDQILVCNEALLNKPTSLDEAREHLLFLRGQQHYLICGAVIAENGVEVWRSVNQARLKMREFSEGFLDYYLENAQSDALDSVGSYHLEALGAQLFEKITGDYFTILGLPLLEILAYLRQRELIGS